MHGVARVRTHVVGALLAFVLLVPVVASAQSAISGIVRDTSGAVLPGVTVEASSSVLIEKTRSVVTDGEGRYTITDLRPGAYTVVFTLTGFNTFRRDGLDLPANFTMTINADLRVGALEESITVTGDAPIVDVQSTQRTHVLNRDLLDALPTARNYSGLAALMPGVKMSNTDVGGNQQMEQIYMRVHGSRQTDTTVQVDGMQLNSLMSDGQVQAYFSDAANAEVTYQTSGVGAEVSGGGLRINMIPKEGGNRTSGALFAGGTHRSWQADNTEDLRSRGVTSGDTVDHTSDYNFAIGGPIMQDKLWYFTTVRRIATNEVVAQNFYRDGAQGIEDQWIYNILGRLTYQATSNTKVTAYFDRYPKFKGHEMGAFTDPDTAARRREWKNALYYTTQAKATTTVSSRLLIEGGYSSNVEYFTGKYQPGVEKGRGSAEWFTQTGHEELTTYGTHPTDYRYWNGLNTPSNGTDPRKHVLSGTMSYVTGTHSVKTGVQWGFGPYTTRGDLNGDLIQLYRNGRADSVRVYNTPREAKEYLNADLGIFAQDSWRIERLTINYGVRLEYFNGEISNQAAPAGRFIGARSFEKISCMPCWTDWTPRFGVAYDLFGNARTALKASVNKYMAGQTLGFAQRYNPFSTQSDVRSWADLNGDDVAQDNEIAAVGNNLRFGQPVLTRRPGDDFRREYDWEYSAGIQHELMRGVSVTAAWYHRDSYNMTQSVNGPFTPADYAVVNVVSPIDGTLIPAYNLNSAKQGQVDRVDVNATDANLRSFTYTGLEFGAAARMGRATLFGGWTIDKTTIDHCDELENWGNLSGVYYDASGNNSLQPKSDYAFCNQSQQGLPFLHEFKLSGSYQLPWEIQVNAALQSYSGPQLATRWNIGRTTRYSSNCLAPCVPGALVIPNMTPANYILDLVAPGTQYYDRLNQLDLGFRKIFHIGRYQFSGQADFFNFLNAGYVKSQVVNYDFSNAANVDAIRTIGPEFGTVTATLQPRTMRLAMQMRF